MSACRRRVSRAPISQPSMGWTADKPCGGGTCVGGYGTQHVCLSEKSERSSYFTTQHGLDGRQALRSTRRLLHSFLPLLWERRSQPRLRTAGADRYLGGVLVQAGFFCLCLLVLAPGGGRRGGLGRKGNFEDEKPYLVQSLSFPVSSVLSMAKDLEIYHSLAFGNDSLG